MPRLQSATLNLLLLDTLIPLTSTMSYEDDPFGSHFGPEFPKRGYEVRSSHWCSWCTSMRLRKYGR